MTFWDRVIVSAVVVGAVVGVLLVGYSVRDQLDWIPGIARLRPAAQPANASGIATPAPATEASTDASGVARAPLTLDARRQQLIGVRLATVERTNVAPTVRAVGM